MNDWTDVWPRGVPQEPALRGGRSGLRLTRELYEAMGQPKSVDIVFRLEGPLVFMGLRPGSNHVVRTRRLDHALSVNSRPLGRILSADCKARWLLATNQDGLWGAIVTLKEAEYEPYTGG